MIDPKLLEILVCPLGKGPLQLEGNKLVCTQCGPRFSFTREGYPNLVLEDAELPEGCDKIENLKCVKSK
ncbi:MAG TPA: Trm112 family protein [Gemmatales bacterium]|nr:Trm112 family protein [Gemmatales bacterium]HMP18096.1 Trm112 family protein [Gemmatales bacterium]